MPQRAENGNFRDQFAILIHNFLAKCIDFEPPNTITLYLIVLKMTESIIWQRFYPYSASPIYAIEVTDLAIEELSNIRAFERRPILEAIRQQLTYEPTVTTRNRKLLESLIPSFESVPPIWELRIGAYRIFYDVDEAEKIVYIRAIRRKTPEQTTEDIVQ
jgi:mRNA-degrading endonuclease RelE of RelBE toxin-antitoxin system